MICISKMNDAWDRAFDSLDLNDEIKSNGYAYVTASELKKYGQREPRLMAKLDTKEVRPDIFKNNNLTIFPVINGKYIIFKDDNSKSYYKFNSVLDDVPVVEYRSKIDLGDFQSFPASREFSESQALDFAYLSSLIKTFTGEDDLFLTIRGRLRSHSFDYQISEYDHTVNVSNVQIEVDAGYESQNRIYLIEAKIGKRDNFHIRQLYYPFMEWSGRTTKEIIPIFFTYTNGLFYLTQFEFGECFGDIRIVKNKCFTINESSKNKINLTQLLESISVGIEPDTPYPQADDLDKVIDVVAFVEDGYDTKFDIADYFEFDERQGDYYANAAKYLGFLDKTSRGKFELTKTGHVLIDCNHRVKRNELLLNQLLKRPTFSELVSNLKYTGLDIESLDTDTIAKIIEKHTPLTGTTPKRRASTVKSWLKWVFKNIEIDLN